MEIHRQTCQKCNSRNLKNILVREVGGKDKVYVQCFKCKELVARYVLAPSGYYHHHKGFDSYLRGLRRGGFVMSGRNLNKEFSKTAEKCEQEFEKVLDKLHELKKEED